MRTLWDLIEPAARMILPGLSRPARPPAPASRPTAPSRIAPPAVEAIRAPVPAPDSLPSKPPARAESAQENYDRVVQHMLTTHKIRVRRWRTAMSGVAWQLQYRDGTTSRLLESPKPKGPMSMAVFLHEVGHHAIGFNRYKPRCLEEYHAWRWSLEAMDAHALNITDSVRYRMHLSLWYAVSKAQRRGLKALPPELAPFTERPKKIKATDRATPVKQPSRRLSVASPATPIARCTSTTLPPTPPR